MPDITKQIAKEYLMKNDELSSWFLDQYEERKEVDRTGNIVNFVTVKEVMKVYQGQPIFLDMKSADRRKFNEKKFKEEIEKNPILRPFFREAKKVKVQTEEGGKYKYNAQHGLIHFRRKQDVDEEYDEYPPGKRFCQ